MYAGPAASQAAPAFHFSRYVQLVADAKYAAPTNGACRLGKLRNAGPGKMAVDF